MLYAVGILCIFFLLSNLLSAHHFHLEGLGNSAAATASQCPPCVDCNTTIPTRVTHTHTHTHVVDNGNVIGVAAPAMPLPVAAPGVNTGKPEEKNLLEQEASGVKAECEMKYWDKMFADDGGAEGMRAKRMKEYEKMMTTKFSLDKSDFDDKRILDIGPGPRGSLEWADNARVRVGLDPIAERYMDIGIVEQDMSYVMASSSAIPFPSNYFDFVVTLNALDHVEEMESTILEIQRVIRPGGMFLMLVDVQHPYTPCEPQRLEWEFADKFTQLRNVEEKHYEKYCNGCTREGVIVTKPNQPFDHNVAGDRYGVLQVKYVKD